MKSLQRFLQNAFDQLSLISKTVDQNVTLQDLQNRLRNNPAIQEFLQASSPDLLVQDKNTDADVFHLHHELQKFLISQSVSNLPHHFDCLIVPFERYLQKKVADPDLLITTTDTKSSRSFFPIRLLLENLRSDFNVGSIFRSAECLGAEKIELCGYTPLPQKTDMGTKEMVPHSSRSIDDAISEAKQLGYTIIGLETAPQSETLLNIQLPDKVCFVLGNERHGLLPETLKKCDQIAHIPLLGNKNSLNVGITASLALYEYLRRRK